MAESRFVQVKGLKLHYLDYGMLGRPPLICVHGLTGNAHNFDAVGSWIASSFHVRSFDVRGRGDSEWGPPGEYAIPNYVSDLEAALDTLKIGRLSLIGTSMGGIISMLFAAASPDRVERLALNDIGPEIDLSGIRRISAYVGEAPSEFKDLAEVVKYYRAIYPPVSKLPEPAVTEFARWAVKSTEKGTLTWKMDPAVRRGIRGGDARAAAPDLWPLFSRIKAQVLIVRGAESDILSAPVAKRMCQVLPGAELVEVAGVGHAPSLSEPEAVAALRRFFGVS